MKHSDNPQGSAEYSNKAGKRSEKESNDFIIGLVTFPVFIEFMTAWMCFSI